MRSTDKYIVYCTLTVQLIQLQSTAKHFQEQKPVDIMRLPDKGMKMAWLEMCSGEEWYI